MFDVTEYRVVPSEPKTLEAAIPAAAHQAALAPLVPIMPQVWQGKSAQARWGLFPSIMARIAPGQGGTSIELRVGAELDTTMMVVFIVVTLFFWPAGLIIGWLAYDDFTKRRVLIFQSIWQQLGANPLPAPGYYGMGGPPPGPPPGGFSGHYG